MIISNNNAIYNAATYLVTASYIPPDDREVVRAEATFEFTAED
jgi:hypothetical protein